MEATTRAGRPCAALTATLHGLDKGGNGPKAASEHAAHTPAFVRIERVARAGERLSCATGAGDAATDPKLGTLFHTLHVPAKAGVEGLRTPSRRIERRLSYAMQRTLKPHRCAPG